MKKVVNLEKKLVLVKEIVNQLESEKQKRIAGGRSVGCVSAGSPTYDPQAGCETRPCNGVDCW